MGSATAVRSGCSVRRWANQWFYTVSRNGFVEWAPISHKSIIIDCIVFSKAMSGTVNDAGSIGNRIVS